MDKEVWKDVKGYEGLYQVSNLGRVRSLDHIDTLGRHRKERILAGGLGSEGYLTIILCRDGKHKTHIIHRLVAQAFLDNSDNLPQVNHKDEDKTNNVVSNLEWCTAAYNMNYGTRNKRARKAITRKQGKPVYVIPSSGHHYYFDSLAKAAVLLGLSEGAVSSCLNGKLKHHHGFTFELAEQHA